MYYKCININIVYSTRLAYIYAYSLREFNLILKTKLTRQQTPRNLRQSLNLPVKASCCSC